MVLGRRKTTGELLACQLDHFGVYAHEDKGTVFQRSDTYFGQSFDSYESRGRGERFHRAVVREMNDNITKCIKGAKARGWFSEVFAVRLNSKNCPIVAGEYLEGSGLTKFKLK